MKAVFGWSVYQCHPLFMFGPGLEPSNAKPSGIKSSFIKSLKYLKFLLLQENILKKKKCISHYVYNINIKRF